MWGLPSQEKGEAMAFTNSLTVSVREKYVRAKVRSLRNKKGQK